MDYTTKVVLIILAVILTGIFLIGSILLQTQLTHPNDNLTKYTVSVYSTDVDSLVNVVITLPKGTELDSRIVPNTDSFVTSYVNSVVKPYIGIVELHNTITMKLIIQDDKGRIYKTKEYIDPTQHLIDSITAEYNNQRFSSIQTLN